MDQQTIATATGEEIRDKTGNEVLGETEVATLDHVTDKTTFLVIDVTHVEDDLLTLCAITGQAADDTGPRNG